MADTENKVVETEVQETETKAPETEVKADPAGQQTEEKQEEGEK